MNAQSPSLHAPGDWCGSRKTLSELVGLFGGTLLGNDTAIQGVGALITAGAGELSFALAQVDALQIEGCQAAALVAHPRWHNLLQTLGRSAIISPNPYPLFAKIAQRFFAQPKPAIEARTLSAIASDISHEVTIGAYATIGQGVSIGAGSVIGAQVSIGDRVKLGRDVWLYPHVTIYPDTVIGDGVMIHSGCVIGADGFGFQPEMVNGVRRWQKVPQMGKVVIGDRVEIGANSCIDRGAMSDTIIGDDCKFDNMVHIGHGCVVGQRNLFMPQCIMGGSCHIGDDCLFGGQSGVAPGVRIVSGVTVHPKASVLQDINEAGAYSGLWPLQPHRHWLRSQAAIKRPARTK